MNKQILVVLSLILICSSGAAVFAQEVSQPTAQQRLQQWQALSPEERQAKRQALQQQFQNMSPEQKEAFKAEKKAQFQSLTPEQKQTFRNRFAARRAQRR